MDDMSLVNKRVYTLQVVFAPRLPISVDGISRLLGIFHGMCRHGSRII